MKENKLEELIKKLCPNGVEYKKLEDCCNILDNERKPVTKSARIKGEYPYYGANGIQDYVSDYIFDGTFVLVGEDGSVINKNGNPIVTWAEGKIWVNNHAHIIEKIDGIQLRYLYYYIQTINVANLIHGNIPKLNQGDFRKLRIAVPPMEIQLEIVRILDKFAKLEKELEAELETELEARKKQYEYYRDKLLNFGETGNPCDCTHGYFYKQKIKWKKLEAICDLSAGGDINKENVKKEKTKEYSIPVFSNGIGDNALYGYTNIVRITAPCITISARGTIGYCELRKENFYPIVRLICVKSKTDEINIEFLKYYIQTIKFKTPTSGISQLTVPMIKNYQIPIPAIEEQEKIVNVLDRFEKLCNEISEGLSAEIETRKKQYEYYRDNLLTFKELKVEN